MPRQKTQLLTGDTVGIARAAALLSQGELVAFPTETVYGLGADARNDRAVARIFAAKNRPRFNPLILHVASMDAAREIAEFSDMARRLADAFWPGPLTLVLPTKPGAGLSPLISAGLPRVAVRMPAGTVARQLLAASGGPVAAPSANRSGRVSPTDASHVMTGLTGRIAAILDGGPCKVGLESTIIGFEPDPVILRPGGLPGEIIEQCLGHKMEQAQFQSTPTAPGQLASHYATAATIRLNATGRKNGELLLGFGAVECDFNLSRSGDLTEAAANLFHHLQKLDTLKAHQIAVSPIPGHGLGRAINDRLSRAAAPRP